MPKFTVIAPVYNTESYLPRFLDSVINQTFADFEMLLIDDGSDDGSLALCREYQQKDSRIKIFTQQNCGAGPARNKGIKYATGEYLLFLDSDDWIDTSMLETLWHAMSAHPCDLLIFGAQEVIFNRKEDEIKRNSIIPKIMEVTGQKDCRNEFCDLIFTSVLNTPWNKLFKKSVVDEYSVEFADTRRAQDAFFNMEYYKHIKSLYSIPDVLYYYRANTIDKVWKKFPMDFYKIDIRYDRYMVEIFREFGIYEGEARRKVDAHFFNAMLRTAGFCRNPKWGFSHREKLEYIERIITDEYNQERATQAEASTESLIHIKKYILQKDSRRMLAYFYKRQCRNKLYNFYAEKIKPKIKG